MISSNVSRASAAFLGVCGVALLFASDVLLPVLVPDFPPTAVWVGQLLAASWLGIAFFNWNARGSILGGIYGRPIVQLNLFVYLVGALALLKSGHLSGPIWIVAGPMIAFAAVYTAMLLRGPFDAPPPR